MSDTLSLLMLQPGRDLWLGSSSDPDHVLVTGIRGDMVHFKRIPMAIDAREGRMEADTFLALAWKGTWAHLRRFERFLECRRAYVMPSQDLRWLEGEVVRINAILAGEAVPLKAETDFLQIDVRVRPLKVSGDPWTYLDEITGQCCNTMDRATGIYEVSVIGVDELVRLQGDPNIEVVGYAFRVTGGE